jgi:hypothetical protein
MRLERPRWITAGTSTGLEGSTCRFACAVVVGFWLLVGAYAVVCIAAATTRLPSQRAESRLEYVYAGRVRARWRRLVSLTFHTEGQEDGRGARLRSLRVEVNAASGAGTFPLPGPGSCAQRRHAGRSS